MPAPDLTVDPLVVHLLTDAIITGLLKGGPKDGQVLELLQFTDEIEQVQWSAWSARQNAYYAAKSTVSGRLYWRVTIQRDWLRAVANRKLITVEGRVVLFARKLHTRHFETFDVQTLRRGTAFTAQIESGYVFRHDDLVIYHRDRKLGTRRIKQAIAERTVALLNPEVLT